VHEITTSAKSWVSYIRVAFKKGYKKAETKRTIYDHALLTRDYVFDF